MDPSLIATKAIGGAQLTPAERAALTPALLETLAIGRHLVLTAAERARLSPSQLANLAIGRFIQLTQEEIDRLPETLCTQLEIGRFIDRRVALTAAATTPTSSALSNSHEGTSVTTSFEPTTTSEEAVRDALILLVVHRDDVLISSDHLRALCRASPEYALRLIDLKRTNLLLHAGKRRADIARVVRTVEWELRGPSKYIEYNHLGDTEEAQFICSRLTDAPEEFTSDDLHALLQHFKKADHPIRAAALQVLSNHVASLAERISAEPAGMSEDIESLKQSVRNYGFNPDLNAILQKVDDQLQGAPDGFDQAATMRHIRSFFEQLHEHVGRELQRRKPNVGNGTPLGKCGQAIDYLERKGVITDKFQVLARSLYVILSDGDYGVHALKATRDYTRLCRNMVVEYAVTLFFELERRLSIPDDQ